MKRVLRNISSEDLIFGLVPANSEIVLYDDVTFETYASLDDIYDSITEGNIDSNNMPFQLYSGQLVYKEDDAFKDRYSLFEWLNNFKPKYEYFKQFRASGFIDVKVDDVSNVIIIGNKKLSIDDIPNGIPATKIGSGEITNLDFQTLKGINTSLTIQEQLNAKADVNHNHTYTFILSTPSTLWTITHGLGVRPQVELFDSQYNLVFASVDQPDNNTVTVKFSKNCTCIANLTI